MISNAFDAAGASAAPDAAIGINDAIAIAADYAGRSPEHVRVLHARAPRTYSDQPQPVWVVLFDGGVSPVGPPIGFEGTLAPFTITGVLVDDQTGEVLRLFMC